MSDQFTPPPPPDSLGESEPNPPSAQVPDFDAGFASVQGQGYDPRVTQQHVSLEPPRSSPGRETNRTVLIVVVALILLCCCSTIGAGVWAVSSGAFAKVLQSGAGSVSQTGATPSTGSGQGVGAWLSWSEPVDIDLEVYDAAGTTLIGSAYRWSGDDITDGSQGDEYMEFRTYDTYDFSSGQYTLVAYYFSSSDTRNPDTTVELTIRDAGGGVQTFAKTIQYDASSDQWFALRIDAATGAVTTVDRVE